MDIQVIATLLCLFIMDSTNTKMSIVKTKPNLDYDYNVALDVITIEGIAYSGDLFREAAFSNLGTWMRLEDRNHGSISVFTPNDDTASLFDAMTGRT